MPQIVKTVTLALALVAGIGAASLLWSPWEAAVPPLPGAVDADRGGGGDPSAGQAVAPATRAPPAAARTAPALPLPDRLATDPLAPTVRAIHLALRAGATATACRQVEAHLVGLVTQAPTDSPTWSWAMDRARDCLRAPHRSRAKSPLLEALLDSHPAHPRALELAGLQAWDAGQMEESIVLLEQALDADPRGGSFEAWETLAEAQLALRRQLQDTGTGDDALRSALLRAEQAALAALERATEDTRPFALHTLARTQLDLGRPAEAVRWADQSLAALQESTPQYQAFVRAELHVYVGQIYYRAGQPDTGLAYMQQGIGLATSDRQRADLQRVRDDFLQRVRA